MSSLDVFNAGLIEATTEIIMPAIKELMNKPSL